jgi:SAM-dependent methyltransferase
MDTSQLSLFNRLTYHTLRTAGQASDSVRLGFQRGFDSGEMMDRIYQNQASGRWLVGALADRLYLDQPGCRGLRGRKVLLKASLRSLLDAQRQQGLKPFVVDVASGPATYLVETLAEDAGPDVRALARDLDASGLKRGQALAQQHGITNIRYEQANALDEASLTAIQPRLSIVIASGFYEILLDDEWVRTSMRLNRKLLAPGGTFVFTTQVNHPQVEMIRALPNRDHESWVLKNRAVAEVEAWARAAGFNQLSTTFEESRIFSVTVAQP